MKNNSIIIFLLLILNISINSPLLSDEQFNFDVTEVEIKDNGNKFIGRKRGIATTNNGLSIEADNFEYDKTLNLLNADGNIKFKDEEKKIYIFADKILYLKNKEIITSKGNSKAILANGVIITADKFKYNKIPNILNAYGNVKIDDTKKNNTIFTEEITYLKNDEIIFTKGKTKITIDSKFIFNSKDVLFKRNEGELISKNISTIQDDNLTFYELEKFRYFLDQQLLNGEDVKVITNYSKKKSDTFNFENIIINFSNKNFKAKDTEILFHKTIFDKERKKFIDLENPKLNELFEDYYDENNPRLLGVSSQGDENITIINKGIFTSCKKTDTCPAWSMKSEKITHDKKKKQVIYKNAFLNIYDVPVFYFPKFFHPDPTVERQSGLLKPQINNSQILGSSFYLPYFHVISKDKDLTIKPTIFDQNIYMLNSEYRQKNKNSSFIADLGLTKGYQSSVEGSNRNSIGHIFAKFNSNLKLDNFLDSRLDIFFEKVSNDNYLRLFDANIENSPVKPKSFEKMYSGIQLKLDHDNYNLTSGFSFYENLSGSNSDRFQYVFPYYDFSKNIETDLNGSFNFSSSGNNRLQNTNNLRTSLINNLDYQSQDFISNLGFNNNFNIYFKNTNTIAKNDEIYKSSLQTELMNIFELTSSLPLVKREDNQIYNTLTPRISFRANPTNMRNHHSTSRSVNADNIFNINRLGISDSFESGRSLTIGVDYRKENLQDLEKFFELKLSTVMRDKEEYDVPVSSTLNRKNSNIFGSIENRFSENVKFDYNFSIDNDFQTFEDNSIKTEFSVNNFVTEFIFTEKSGELGSQNTLENTTSIKLDDNNYFTFNTRRNRKTSLTEYYDLVYEYKNDCLTAGIKYKKTYYNNGDIKPNEDLFFSITLFPLTTFEQKVDQN